jgi:uncharacterized protein YndB with AHSA1/START domain
MTEMTATELRLERTYDAPRERVYDAWTNPEVLRRWWAAGPDFEGVAAEIDVRAGGRIRLTMRAPDGQEHSGGGRYTEVDPPGHLAYTWAWEGTDGHESLVSVDFVEVDGATTVRLVHTGLASEESVAQHGHGWSACLDNLGRVLSP